MLNTTSDFVKISIPSPMLLLEIIDMSGKRSYVQKNTTDLPLYLDVSAYVPGIYVVRGVTMAGEHMTGKLIIVQ